MISEIHIAGLASYSTEGTRLQGLRSLNFIYGANGSGKTTLARLVDAPGDYPSCALSWVNNAPLHRLVYNVDFVARNFASSIPGIFTLGEQNVEVLARIEQLKGEIETLAGDIANRKNTLHGADGAGGKVGELRTLRAGIQQECWQAKGRHDEHFKGAFTGLRNNQSNFCDRMLAEWTGNTAALHSLDDLKARANVIFDDNIRQESEVAAPNAIDLIAGESAEVLGKKIVGTGDVDIAALIDRIGNSDWVKAGIGFYDQSQPHCPFCQQQMDADLARKIRGYFDETYEHDMARLDLVARSYEASADAYITGLEALCAAPSRYLDSDGIRSLTDRAKARLLVNRQGLARKRAEPSAVVALEDNRGLFDEITVLIDSANAEVRRHNAMVADQGNQRQILTGEIWKFLIEENRGHLDAYNANKAARDAAINAINAAIVERSNRMADAERDLRDLERRITSVQPTVTEINAILASFGFRGFKLATAGDRGHLYEIVRLDGTDAARTLSEGERTFIAFLYFYHLIRGSHTESGMTEDRVVVFDDPVSSLDSDVLFIVSSLIKRVFDQCRSGQLIKQVFVLTHNIYFHKEVSFNPRRSSAECLRDETFWIVKKRNDVTIVENHPANPIKTSYELLWGEVKDENRSLMTIQNTLRRILENYFKILGNLDKDDICDKFDGREKVICNSLFSWVNDGSHYAHDDLYLSADQGIVDSYLSVFRRIFEKTGHDAHYHMMMGTSPANDAEPAEVPPVQEVA